MRDAFRVDAIRVGDATGIGDVVSVGDGHNYVIIGRPESGYSMKVRSAMRYKGVAFEWMERCLKNEKFYQAHAKVQLIPLVFLPDGTPIQDSTPIIERLERDHPAPSLHPEDAGLRFLSEVVEEYGDEWANKLMFYHRWGYPADQKHRSGTLARGMSEGHPLRWFAPITARFIVRRMVPRLSLAGANENNAPILIESFANLVSILEAHLRDRAYLFGARPAFGDFGLWGQLHQAFIDPTCGAHLRDRGPSVVAWIERMLTPTAEGDFESLDALEATLRPLFAREIGPRFLAWDEANTRALAAGDSQTELTMDGKLYYQRTFKYPAQTLSILKGKFAAAAGHAKLRTFLEETDCLPYFASSAPS
jgi:glutathione S-transferase